MPKRKYSQQEKLFLSQEQIEGINPAINILVKRRLRVTTEDGFYWKCRILIGYKHGMRNAEIDNLRWSDIDFKNKLITFKRVKGGKLSIHNLLSKEITYLKKLQKDNRDDILVFAYRNHKTPSRNIVNKWYGDIGTIIGIPTFSSHHLRHTCGYHLAKAGRSLIEISNYLGHTKAESSMVYCRWLPENMGADIP